MHDQSRAAGHRQLLAAPGTVPAIEGAGAGGLRVLFVVGVAAFVVGIGISIAWHELGHFVAARRFGVRVPQFMVGWGPTVFSRRVGESEFGVKALPVGGYIRMIGMVPPAPGQAMGRSRRSGLFQGLIDDVRAQSADECAPAMRTASSTPARRGSGS